MKCFISEAFKSRHYYTRTNVKNDYVWYWMKKNRIAVYQIARYMDTMPDTFTEMFVQKKREPRLWQALYLNYLSNNEIPLTSMTTELDGDILRQLRVNLVENKTDRELIMKKITGTSIEGKFRALVEMED